MISCDFRIPQWNGGAIKRLGGKSIPKASGDAATVPAIRTEPTAPG